MLTPTYQLSELQSRETSPARDDVPLHGFENSSTAYLNSADTERYPVRHLGVPRRKQRLDWINAAMLATSFILFGIAVLVIHPGTGLAYRLGYNYQLTALGIILALQTLCTKRSMQKCFLLLEASLGSSTLHNYDTILTNSALVEHASLIWRILIVVFILVPIGLSAAYKQFPDGRADSEWTMEKCRFGLFGPPRLDGIGYHTGITVLGNIIFPYLSSTQNDSIPVGLNQVFGYNTLLVNSTAAAMLDGPFPAYISNIQNQLGVQENREINATVNAVFTVYQEPAIWNTTDFWDSDVTNSSSVFGSKLDSYDRWTLVVTNWAEVGLGYDLDNVLIGLVPSGVAESDDDLRPGFQQHAMLFQTTRRQCHGSWKVNSSSITLVAADCNGKGLSRIPFSDFTFAAQSFHTFYLPLLMEYLGQFQPDYNGNFRVDSPWRIPTAVSVVAGVLWARRTGQIADKPTANGTYDYYTDCQLRSSRHAIKAEALLYFIMLALPVLVVIFSSITFLCHGVPLDNGFSLTAILAGIEVGSVEQLRGAGLSGELNEKVTLAISTRSLDPNPAEAAMNPTSRREVVYTIGGSVGREDWRNGGLSQRSIWY